MFDTKLREFRILGEYRPEVFDKWLEEVTKVFPGFSVVYGRGFWQGAEERSFILTVLVGSLREYPHKDVLELARRYKDLAMQESVWVTESEARLSAV